MDRREQFRRSGRSDGTNMNDSASVGESEFEDTEHTQGLDQSTGGGGHCKRERRMSLSDFGTPVNSDTHVGTLRDKCGGLVNARPVQRTISILILFNSLLLGVMTLYSVQENETLVNVFQRMDLTILSIFSAEVLLQLAYLGLSRFFRHGWMLFDAIVVIISWAFMNSSITVLRSLRIFRILAVMSRWVALRTLFEAIGKTVPKVRACLLLHFG